VGARRRLPGLVERADDPLLVRGGRHREADGALRGPKGRDRPALYAALERETLLVHSSDWPFLIDNGVSKDYALGRIAEHVADFWTLAQLADEGLPAEGDAAATAIREKDRLFEQELRRR